MSKRPQKQDSDSKSQGLNSSPNFIKFKNVTNQSPLPEGSADISALRSRIEQLQSKVATLEHAMSVKKKRIRRKSSEVDRRFQCEICHKMYGSMVSLNLHLRIKHNQGEQSKKQQNVNESLQN